jgi:hypothetical protein
VAIRDKKKKRASDKTAEKPRKFAENRFGAQAPVSPFLNF